jgi:hypothetical protein
MVAVSEGVEHSAITSTTNVWDEMPKSNVPTKIVQVYLGV